MWGYSGCLQDYQHFRESFVFQRKRNNRTHCLYAIQDDFVTSFFTSSTSTRTSTSTSTIFYSVCMVKETESSINLIVSNFSKSPEVLPMNVGLFWMPARLSAF